MSVCGQRHPDGRRGMTLVELLVVLTILALLTGVAVTSTDVFLGQGRYDATKHTLDAIREAIVGQSSSNAGSVTGFVIDMGRLPASLSELLTAQPSFQTWEFDSDDDGTRDVFLSSGWRGPYLHLAPGQNTLLDGWGNALNWMITGGTLTVTSYGSDGVAGATSQGYDRDISLVIQPEEYVASQAVFHLRELDANGNEQDPVLDSDDVLELRLYQTDSNSGKATLVSLLVDRTVFQRVVTGLPIGTIAVRALLRDTTGGTIKKKSAPMYLTLQPRGNVYQKLILR